MRRALVLFATLLLLWALLAELNLALSPLHVWVFAGGLHPSSTATVVRAVDGEVVTTDGPYAEAKEVIGGFWVIEAPDLDVALKLAAEGSKACGGKVEVRPFQGEG